MRRGFLTHTRKHRNLEILGTMKFLRNARASDAQSTRSTSMMHWIICCSSKRSAQRKQEANIWAVLAMLLDDTLSELVHITNSRMLFND